ncbi:MAG TPA: hypothetical protein VMZ30_13845 [Pyrinomonadaceae bacterium]|nr:hypothetical protein [Pyrinomonadaceae bacterium]
MSVKKNLRYSFILAALFLFAGTAAAQGPVVDNNTTTSNLEMTATVQTAVQLNISTGTGGATVSGSNSTGLFSISFGNVNGLGVGNTQNANITVVADGSGALYKTPINLTPVYSGFASETADITVEAGVSGDEALAREGDSSISSSSTVSSTPATVISNAASDSNNTRYVGFYIPKGESAGTKTATLIYTITVQ